MALNQQDRMLILESNLMQTRFKAACLKYANYLLGVSQEENQLAWARQCLDNPQTFGHRVSYYLLEFPPFWGSGTDSITGDTWSGGSSISDVVLQGQVEAVINNYFIQ